MKKTLAASLFALSLFAACSGNAASSVPGTYELDKTAMRAAMEANIPAEAKANAEAAKAMQAELDKAVNGMSITIDLKADNTLTYTAKMGTMMNEAATGTWKLDGNKLSMTTKDKAGKEETKTADYANGSFSMEEEMGPGQKMKMTFKKK